MRRVWVSTMILLSACDGMVSEPLNIEDFSQGELGEQTRETADPGDSISVPTAVSQQVRVFRCEDESARSPSPTYVLGRRELENTLDDIFGPGTSAVVAVELGLFPSDVYDLRTHTRRGTISDTSVRAMHEIATSLANAIVLDSDWLISLVGGCAFENPLTQACIDNYIVQTGEKIFRRPLHNAERDWIFSLANRDIAPIDAWHAVLTYQLQSISFLVRLEDGQPALDAPAVANRLSYMLVDAPPDADLLHATSSNALLSLENIHAHALRLLQTERGRRKLVDAIAHYSLADHPQDITSLPQALLEGVQVEGLGTAMVDELRTYIEFLVYEQNATFEDLLTSDLSFAAHPGLAAIYGHKPAVDGVPEQMANGRRGVLLRAGAFAWPGARSSIIHRGVDFQERVFCNDIPPPTLDITLAREEDALSPEEERASSNRIVVEHMTRDAACMTCHSLINPTGAAFEHFDPLGRYRTHELLFDEDKEAIGEIEVQPAGNIPLPSGDMLAVEDANDLIDYVARSSVGKACFVRTVYRYLYETLEVPENDCQLEKMLESMEGSSTILENVATLVAHASLMEKTL